MRGDHAFGVHHRITLRLGLIGDLAVDPKRVQPEGRLARGLARQLQWRAFGVDHHHLIGADVALGHINAVDLERVAVDRQAHVILDPHRGHGETELFGEMFAQGFDLAWQHRVGTVGQRHQPFAQHQPQLVEVHGVGIDLRHVLLFLRFCIGLCLGLCRLCRAALDHHAQAHHGSGQKGEDQQRKARQKADTEQQQSRHVKRLGEVRQLVKDRLVRRAARAAFRHDQTGGERHYQRRNLAHQPVADGQRGKDVKGIAHTHAALHDADEDAADDVDQRDNEPRHRIAAHEFRRTVHGTEKRAFVFQLLTATTRFVLVDQPRAHIGIDRHLLARHCI